MKLRRTSNLGTVSSLSKHKARAQFLFCLMIAVIFCTFGFASEEPPDDPNCTKVAGPYRVRFSAFQRPSPRQPRGSVGLICNNFLKGVPIYGVIEILAESAANGAEIQDLTVDVDIRRLSPGKSDEEWGLRKSVYARSGIQLNLLFNDSVDRDIVLSITKNGQKFTSSFVVNVIDVAK